MAKSVIRGMDKLKAKLSGKDLEKTSIQSLLSTLLSTTTVLPGVSIGFRDDVEYPDGTLLAQVAYWTEFGNGKTKQRPFMRATIAKHRDEWANLLLNCLKRADFDLNKALTALGGIIAQQMQDEIKNGEFEPDSAVTNLLKDRFPKGGYEAIDYFKAVHDVANGKTAPAGKTLVWSGQMLQSVTFQVNND